MYRPITYDSLTKFGLNTVRDSRDHFFNFDNLLIKNIPAPWDLSQGFIIHVLDGFLRYSDPVPNQFFRFLPPFFRTRLNFRQIELRFNNKGM